MEKWLLSLQSSSLFRPPPKNSNLEHQTELLSYVDLFGQLASESFVDDIGELVRSQYPSEENRLLDDVLATFVLHHPEHGHAALHALLSCVIDGTLVYDKKTPPFRAFVSLFSPSTEREFSEQWAVACGEILRVLTYYNRPTHKAENGQTSETQESPTSGKGAEKDALENSTWEKRGRKASARLLTPWITDSLLAASPEIRNDYFRWCGGVTGNYAAGVLRPPTTVGHGKQSRLLPSSPRWAVANGAAVILSVCNYEVARYETADLTASAVPALLIRPPPPAVQANPQVVHGIPPLETYVELFHRYYSIATPGATQRLLLGLLEIPPAGSAHGILVAVALIEMLRVADDCSAAVQLPRDWLHVHFLNPAGIAIASETGVIADAAASLLFHIFSQPALLLPPPSLSHGMSAFQSLYGSPNLSSATEEAKAAAIRASEDAIARGLAALMVGHGPDVEWCICGLWEAALGLRPLSPFFTNLPKFLLSTPLQPPPLSWNLMRPVLRVLEFLPPTCESRDCLRRIFNATVEAILQRTFPGQEMKNQENGNQNKPSTSVGEVGAQKFGMAELRAMVHCLFTDSFLSPNLAAQLLSDALTICLSHDSKREMRIAKVENPSSVEGQGITKSKDAQGSSSDDVGKNRGAAATFDSYVVAAVCALACEVRLLSFSPGHLSGSKTAAAPVDKGESKGHGGEGGSKYGERPFGASAGGFPIGVVSLVEHTKRLGVLELLLAGSPSASGPRARTSTTSTEMLAESVVAAHMSALLVQSRACLHSLAEIMKCEWDPGICAQAAAVIARIERNRGLLPGRRSGRSGNPATGLAMSPVVKGNLELVPRESNQTANVLGQNLPSTFSKVSSNKDQEMTILNGQKQKYSFSVARDSTGKQVASLPLEAVDTVALLCDDRWHERSAAVASCLRPIIIENQELAIGSVALLCQRLVFSPEIPINTEETSAGRGWHQVVDAICSMAAALPEKVAPFIVAQADIQLKPWSGRNDVQSQKSIWRINIRIVGLLSGLLRLSHIPYVVRSVVQDCALLRRATDGLTVDGETCILPQLELLEAASMAAQASLKWDEAYAETAKSLISLLKDRLPATVRCLSHSSAHVRAMSLARLRDMLYSESFKSRDLTGKFEDGDSIIEEISGDSFWRRAVEQCVAWETHYRRAGGLSTSFLSNATSTLGCSIPT